jgi:hypothetical protein
MTDVPALAMSRRVCSSAGDHGLCFGDFKALSTRPQ